MAEAKKRFETVDEYIASFPADVQDRLQAIRATIREEAPRAEEVISYQIPAFKLDGKYVLYVAAWKDHVGLYPIPSGSDAFREELAPYVASKGTVKLPFGEPLPLPLIRKLVRYSVEENVERRKHSS